MYAHMCTSICTGSNHNYRLKVFVIVTRAYMLHTYTIHNVWCMTYDVRHHLWLTYGHLHAMRCVMYQGWPATYVAKLLLPWYVTRSPVYESARSQCEVINGGAMQHSVALLFWCAFCQSHYFMPTCSLVACAPPRNCLQLRGDSPCR